MRNLRNIQRSAITFPEEGLPPSACTWDVENNSLICVFGPAPCSTLIELKRVKFYPNDDERHHMIASWDAPCPNPDTACDKVLDVHYFPDTASYCLILAGGDIVVVREDPLAGEELLEIVGSVDAGITAAAWSPDEELLSICTKAGTFLLMSRDFENVADVSFSPEDIKASNHVSVGWGKAETQFKGKRAKTLHDPTMPEKVDEGVLSEFDDMRVTISWRGDGAYVAVNAVEGSRRMIRVLSREGVLDSVSEPVDNLEGALSWRPAGNIIAGIQRRTDQTAVVFFERNGLHHGSFPLRLSDAEKVDWGSKIELKWNVDSTVLAVCFVDRVQLWTMGNYHYYLKQEIRLPGPQDLFGGLIWHPERPLQLAIFGTYGKGMPSGGLSATTHVADIVLLLDYTTVVAKGPVTPPDDYGVVSVIDGRNLLLTPLRHGNVPPPMALHELHLEHNIVDVAMDPLSSCLAVLDFAGFSVYEYKISSKKAPAPKLLERRYFEEPHMVPYQLVIGGQDELYILAHDWKNNRDAIFLIDKEIYGYTEPRISTMFLAIGHKELCVENVAGHVKLIPSVSGVDIPQDVTSPPVFCPQVEQIKRGEEHITIGLSSSGQLYANDRLLTSSCTSFLVTPAHLIFTTTQHLLKFAHLTAVEELEVPPDEPETDERCRSIERGARLVTVIPSASSLVLQMPRGNLETIYPRALVLASIRNDIAELNYKAAFLTCRKQRVDMNILHDHAPQQFMECVNVFIEQIRSVEHIDLFLSQLREEDVSKTMYKETLRQAGAATATAEEAQKIATLATVASESKINRICDAFLKALEDRRATNLQNIITANVCKSPPDLEGGLTVVAKLRALDESLAETAAEHICFLADVNKLYDTALGMYDLDLALVIAQQSQKDPREYLPYLQTLQTLPPLRQHFTIDNDLGRHSKALSSLHELDAFDELAAYAEKHALYAPAIDLYKYNPARLAALTRLYAAHLASNNRNHEAGLAYESLSDYAAALAAYRAAASWREALSCATLIPLPEAEIASLAESLAEGLVEAKEYTDAATVYLDYLDAPTSAARELCKAYAFADALRLVGLKRQPALLEVVDAGLVDGFGAMTELLAECKGQLHAQVPRLRELRVKKAANPLAFYAGDAEPGEGGDFPDNVSLAPTDASTSGGTFLTRYTGKTGGTAGTGVSRRTSKNRRREERKRARGKKGSVYEEEYLIKSIGRLVERVNAVNGEVGRLVEGLVRRGMRERAQAVEGGMRDVVGICEGVVGEVFSAAKKMGEEEGERPVGADGVLWDSLEETRTGSVAPVVKAFERLSLLE
ncbi:IkappaB kinase complex, IKAP component [Trichodelitschia bisporula]|uniref:Elongator complex protein 1 n=1 Tax=Trichodelitschia bisporula TaxID=703511 RepID=A0A6G1HTH5_9PEZI|nr:IkappaB kinase complex, IKAP component [Trichodelitschia bisporula]